MKKERSVIEKVVKKMSWNLLWKENNFVEKIVFHFLHSRLRKSLIVLCFV